MSTLEINDDLSRILDFSGRVIGETIHRDYIELPRWFLYPHSVGIVSDEFLRAAQFDAGWSPQGWRSERPDVFWKPVDPWVTLLVRRGGEFWTIERERCHEETLFHGGYIVLARTHEAAMRLAEFCNSIPDGLQVWPRWRETKPIT